MVMQSILAPLDPHAFQKTTKDPTHTTHADLRPPHQAQSCAAALSTPQHVLGAGSASQHAAQSRPLGMWPPHGGWDRENIEEVERLLEEEMQRGW
jgi:hypothetical protein